MTLKEFAFEKYYIYIFFNVKKIKCFLKYMFQALAFEKLIRKALIYWEKLISFMINSFLNISKTVYNVL